MTSLPSQKKLTTGRFSILSVSQEEEEQTVHKTSKAANKPGPPKPVFGSDIMGISSDQRKPQATTAADPMVVALECQSPGTMVSDAQEEKGLEATSNPEKPTADLPSNSDSNTAGTSFAIQSSVETEEKKMVPVEHQSNDESTPPPPPKNATISVSTGRFSLLHDPSEEVLPIKETPSNVPKVQNRPQPLGNDPRQSSPPPVAGTTESGITDFTVWAASNQVWQQCAKQPPQQEEMEEPELESLHQVDALPPKASKKTQNEQSEQNEKSQQPTVSTTEPKLEEEKSGTPAPSTEIVSPPSKPETKKEESTDEIVHGSRNASSSGSTPVKEEKKNADEEVENIAREMNGKKIETAPGPKPKEVKDAPSQPPKKSYAFVTKNRVQASRKEAAKKTFVVEETTNAVADESWNSVSGTTEEKQLLVLVSLQSFERDVLTNQEKAKTVLHANAVKFETLDGSDLANKERRNELFRISGKRAKYPQFFLVQGSKTMFWGDWHSFQTANENGRIAFEFGGQAPPALTQAAVPAHDVVPHHPSATLEKKFPQFFQLKEGKRGWGHASQLERGNQDLPDPRLVILYSNQSLNRETVANQEKAFTILENRSLPFEAIDGANQQNRERRNELFALSGLRGHYPQFFVVKDLETSFWGGWERFEEQNDEDGLQSLLVKMESSEEPELVLTKDSQDTDSFLVEETATEKLKTSKEALITPATSSPTPQPSHRATKKSGKKKKKSKANESMSTAASGKIEVPTPAPEKIGAEASAETSSGAKPGKAQGNVQQQGDEKTKSRSLDFSAVSRPKIEKNLETDITIFGATSFVAKHVLSYLLLASFHIPRHSVKITLAGRNASKLDDMQKDLTQKAMNMATINKHAKNKKVKFDTFVAEASEYDKLCKMAARTRVVISCAGPFNLYGTRVVESCAEVGTDYVDITGEVHWASEMREKFGDLSKSSGARIVSFCGFDSIPSDMAIYGAVQALRKEIGHNVQLKKGFTWHAMAGYANAGTIHTMLDIPVRLWDNVLTQLPYPFFVDDPLALTHPSVRTSKEMKKRKNSLSFAEWANHIPLFHTCLSGGASAQFAMAAVNAKVVNESAITLSYGPQFTYYERYLPVGFRGTMHLKIFSMIPVLLVQFFLLLGVGFLKIPILGALIANTLFPLGTGMSDIECQNGYAEVYAEVQSAKDPNTGKVDKANCYMKFKGDPGNWVTAQCVVEAALCLLLDKEKLPSRSVDGFGSPAEILGGPLLKRLRTTKVRPMEFTTNVRKATNRWEWKIFDSSS